MDENEFQTLLRKLAKYGVVSREEVKHQAKALRSLRKQKLVKKSLRKGKVFFELTEKSADLLEHHRQGLLAELKTLQVGFPRKKAYAALLGDPRFLDVQDSVVQDFLLLGDWQLNQRVVPSQLTLAKVRYFEGRNR